MIQITETQEKDLINIQKLWATGEVMKFVGFPDGLKKTQEEMKEWLSWIERNRPRINHFSIYNSDENNNDVYYGETFYEIDSIHFSASVDIKLYEFARGRGIGTFALTYAINEAFKNGANKVWVDPNINNIKAIRLYERLGFIKKERPSYLPLDEKYASYIYMEKEKNE